MMRHHTVNVLFSVNLYDFMLQYHGVFYYPTFKKLNKMNLKNKRQKL